MNLYLKRIMFNSLKQNDSINSIQSNKVCLEMTWFSLGVKLHFGIDFQILWSI